MISDKLQNAINKQIVLEYFSANLYLNMAGYFSQLGLSGFEHWMRTQYNEELIHMMKFFNYLLDRGGKAEIGALGKPATEWESPIAVLEDTYQHEQLITRSINELMSIANEIKDYAAVSFLQWYVDEQVEEEDNTSRIYSQLKLIENDKSALFFLDKELSARPMPMPLPPR